MILGGSGRRSIALGCREVSGRSSSASQVAGAADLTCLCGKHLILAETGGAAVSPRDPAIGRPVGGNTGTDRAGSPRTLAAFWGL